MGTFVPAGRPLGAGVDARTKGSPIPGFHRPTFQSRDVPPRQWAALGFAGVLALLVLFGLELAAPADNPEGTKVKPGPTTAGPTGSGSRALRTALPADSARADPTTPDPIKRTNDGGRADAEATSPTPEGTDAAVATRSATPPRDTPPADVELTDVVGAERPSMTTTGVQPGISLTSSGSLTVRTSGAVIENLDITGSLTIRANNVTVRNVRVRSNSSSYGIYVLNGYSGTLIENVEVQMGTDGGTGNGAIGGVGDNAGIGGKTPGSNVTVRRSYIHGIADGIKAANYSLYEYNYIRMRRAAGSQKHIDGIQSSGRTDWTARYNWVDQAYSAGHNAAIFAQAYTGSANVHYYNVTITKNWVNGGVFTIHVADGKFGETGYVHNVEVSDNVFYRDYLYGVSLLRGDVRGNSGFWADTGQLVPRGAIG